MQPADAVGQAEEGMWEGEQDVEARVLNQIKKKCALAGALKRGGERGTNREGDTQ